jgi:hypothetical protein
VCKVLIGSYTFVQLQGRLLQTRANSVRRLFSALKRRSFQAVRGISCIFIYQLDSTHHQAKIISAHEYWLDEFVGDDEDWVSKFWQDLNIVDEESAHIGEPPTPAENTTSTAISSIPTSISSSTVGQQRLSNPDNAERIPFNQKWDVLKPEIERLYITENVPLRDLVRIMKEKHDFDAV